MLAAAAVTAPARAESQREIDAILSRPRLGLADLCRLAELTNPHLAEARADVGAQAGRAAQSAAYPNPELSLGVGEMYLSDPDTRKVKVGVSQALLLGGRRGAAVAAARASLVAAEHRRLLARRDVFRRVHELWAEQLHYREAEAAFAELTAVADSTLEIARARFAARAAPESHVTRALLEVYDLDVARRQLEQDRVRGEAAFTACFGGVSVPLDRLAGDLDPDPAEAYPAEAPEAFATAHPAYEAARQDVAAARAGLREAGASRVPDLGLFLAYGSEEPAGEGFIEAGISVPLPLFDRKQGRVAESRSQLARAEHRARGVASELTVALAAARQRHRRLHEQHDTVADLIAPAATRGRAQAQQAYRAGRLMFLELIDAQRTYAEVRLRTIELRKDLALAEAELTSLLGTGPYTNPGDTP